MVLSKTQLYWLLHIVGWSSIIFIETVNYTFFINEKFEWDYFKQFGLISVLGIFVSHGYKSIFIAQPVFEKSLSKIWGKAFFDTFAISFFMAFLQYLPLIILDFQVIISKDHLISFLGQVMNLGRYVLVWIIIYYLYHILKRNSEISEQKLLLENTAKSSEL